MTRPACPSCAHPIDLHTGYGGCYGNPADGNLGHFHECHGTTLTMVRDTRDKASNPHHRDPNHPTTLDTILAIRDARDTVEPTPLNHTNLPTSNRAPHRAQTAPIPGEKGTAPPCPPL